MRNFRGYRRRKSSSKEKSKISTETPLEIQCNSKSGADLASDIKTPEDDFAAHMHRYIGEMVTVFVKSGGASGLSFTGMLANVNCASVQLITGIGPSPICSLANACVNTSCGDNTGNPVPRSCDRNKLTGAVNSLGSIIYIPVGKIVSFVHNSL